MIEVQHVYKVYRHQEVLTDVSFTIPTGSCVGLMGKSGSGKSTLGRIVAGIERPTRGQLVRDGQALTNRASRKQFVTQVVFQNAVGSVNPNFTVREVLAEALRFHAKRQRQQGHTVPTLTPAAEEDCMRTALGEVGLSHIELSQRATSLSGGQLQRLCLARALMMEPDVIILDEALSGLDPLVQQDMLRLLAALRERKGMSMLFIAHDLGAAYYLCDSLLVMSEGKVAWQTDNLDDWTYEDLESELMKY